MEKVAVAANRIKEKRPAILLKISPDLLESEKKEIAKVLFHIIT